MRKFFSKVGEVLAFTGYMAFVYPFIGLWALFQGDASIGGSLTRGLGLAIVMCFGAMLGIGAGIHALTAIPLYFTLPGVWVSACLLFNIHGALRD